MTATTATAPINPTTVYDSYLEVWNTTDADERLALMRRSWAEDASYVDPLVEVTGLEAVSAVIGQVQQQFTGMRFAPVGQPDGHHHQVRFQWGLGPAGAEPIVVGFDVVVVNSAGLITDVRGFLDVVPS